VDAEIYMWINGKYIAMVHRHEDKEINLAMRGERDTVV
jgi:hypothetical protein